MRATIVCMVRVGYHGAGMGIDGRAGCMGGVLLLYRRACNNAKRTVAQLCLARPPRAGVI